MRGGAGYARLHGASGSAARARAIEDRSAAEKLADETGVVGECAAAARCWHRTRLETQEPATDLTKAGCRGSVLLTCGTYGNVIRLLPPLVISDDLLVEGITVLADVLRKGWHRMTNAAALLDSLPPSLWIGGPSNPHGGVLGIIYDRRLRLMRANPVSPRGRYRGHREYLETNYISLQ